MAEIKEPKSLSPWVMRIFGWIVGPASFAAYVVHKSSLHSPPTTVLDGTFLWIALGLALLPFIRSIKVGELIALERDIGKTQADVNAVRNELHQNVAMLAANVTATASLRNTVNNNNYWGTSGQIDHKQVALEKEGQRATNLRNGSLDKLQSDKAEAPLNQSLDSSREDASWKSQPAIEVKRTEPGQTSDPAPKAPRVSRRSCMELKILNTLLLHQVIKFPDFETRFTFRIDFPTPAESAQYENAVNKLVSEGLIAPTGDRQVFLTDVGFSYSLKNYSCFPSDAWFDPRVVTDAELEKAEAHFSNRNA